MTFYPVYLGTFRHSKWELPVDESEESDSDETDDNIDALSGSNESTKGGKLIII